MGIDSKYIEVDGQNVFHFFCRDCLSWISVNKWRGVFPQHGNTCGQCRITAKLRRPVGVKTRFTVFNPDNFTCRYCGKSAPDVILHVDHIQPVSKGGNNSFKNLITACQDCNFGKSDSLLNKVSIATEK